jgi:hypothetical protein
MRLLCVFLLKRLHAQVGGQSTDFSTIQTEIKTAGLGNDTLAPPDFITHSVQGITWRLGFGVWDKQVRLRLLGERGCWLIMAWQDPEEWQSHPADLNFHLTAATFVLSLLLLVNCQLIFSWQREQAPRYLGWCCCEGLLIRVSTLPA